MKKKYVIILSVITVLLLAIICLFIFVNNNNNSNNNNNNIIIKNDSNVIDLEKFYDEIDGLEENHIFKDYNDFYEVFKSDALTKEDFINNDYVLVTIRFNPCSETIEGITNTSIFDNTLNVEVSYSPGCGLCAFTYNYYLVRINKNTNITKVNVDHKKVGDADCRRDVDYKPMIYLYPNEDMNINVKLGYPSNLITTYPKYNNEWNVYAKTNGDLIIDNKTYYGLYWEGNTSFDHNFNDGFVVKKEDTIPFLEEKLAILGLNEREANEFIIYWLPILEKSNYNLIRFEDITAINEQMPLDINPKPDTIIRVLMKFKHLDDYIEVPKQELKPQTRSGYSVIEWGGTIIQ